MNPYWTDAPAEPITAAKIVASMERIWRYYQARARLKPYYSMLPSTMPEPRRVHRWRGRRYVVARHQVPIREWLRTRGVKFDGE